jgi:hypothetical protein
MKTLILNYIFDNRPCRISQAELARKFTVGHHYHEEGTREVKKESTLRQVRQVIRDLRLDGYPILSDSRGYWYPDKDRSTAEILEFVERFKARAKASAGAYFETVKALRQHLPHDYQPSLDL